MDLIKNGSLRLFRLFGVNVYLHWSWVLVAVVEMYWRKAEDGTLLTHIAEYLCLFLIVLTHEFGHALACKSVGGVADRIVLWPLGGVAFVAPPQRPGAMLWSIAAGPLVNVALIPLTLGPLALAWMMALPDSPGLTFLTNITVINIGLLIFNMLPVYPLDGGQILRSLLWFAVGRGISLIIAAGIGCLGAVGVGILAVVMSSMWLGIVAAFIGMQSFRAVRVGMAMYRLDKMPRHRAARCPHCAQSPPVGAYWGCPCGGKFDTFATGTRCPVCQRTFDVTSCAWCGKSSPMESWYGSSGFPVDVNVGATSPAAVPGEEAPYSGI